MENEFAVVFGQSYKNEGMKLFTKPKIRFK